MSIENRPERRLNTEEQKAVTYYNTIINLRNQKKAAELAREDSKLNIYDAFIKEIVEQAKRDFKVDYWNIYYTTIDEQNNRNTAVEQFGNGKKGKDFHLEDHIVISI